MTRRGLLLAIAFLLTLVLGIEIGLVVAPWSVPQTTVYQPPMSEPPVWMVKPPAWDVGPPREAKGTSGTADGPRGSTGVEAGKRRITSPSPSDLAYYRALLDAGLFPVTTHEARP